MEYKEEYAQVNQNTETDAEYTPQFDGLDDEAPACESPVVVAQPAKKKKFPIYIPIIIAAALVVLSVAAFFVIKMFVPTLEGTWKLTNEEGYEFYYTLEYDGDDGKCDMSLGTVHFPGTFTTSENEDGTQSLNLDIAAGFVYGDYTYEFIGNPMSDDYALKLTDASGTETTLTSAETPQDSDYVMPDENFVPDEKLTGEWEYYYPEYGMSIKLYLNEDGTMIYDQFGMQELHCVYNVNEDTINISFFETELIAQEEGYYFDNDQLIFLGLNWTRVDPDATTDEG